MNHRTCVAALFLLISALVPSHAESIRIACVGDGATYGSTLPERERWSYPARLQDLLGDRAEVRNFGVSGATLLTHGDIPYTQQAAFRESMSFRPDLVLAMLGTNASKPENWAYQDAFVEDYRDLIKAYRTLPSKPRIVLLAPIHASTEGKGISGSRIRKEIIPKVQQVARSTECELIQLHPYFLDHPNWLTDGVHPNSFGTECISDKLASYLEIEQTQLDIRSELKIPFTEHSFHGFRELRFEHQGRICRLVQPLRPALGAPWVWRARFYGHEPQLDIALLEQGFHVAYCDVSGLYGNDVAVQAWDGFYNLLQTLGLGNQPALEGMSRGGFVIYRWASANPDLVACIYADAPVCDFKSWPVRHSGAAATIEELKRAYRFSSMDELEAYQENPLDILEPLAAVRVPLLHVVGQADLVVPVAENTDLLEQRYLGMGGEITVIRKAHVGHHPHSLANPQPILDFVLRHTGRYQNPAARAKPSSEHRGGPAGWGGGTWWDQFENLNRLSDRGGIDLLFLGDSITQSWTGPHHRKAGEDGQRLFDRMYGKRKAASYGISGDRTEHLLYRVEHGGFDRLKPKVIVLMIGVNNLVTAEHSAPDVAEGVAAVVHALRDKTPTSGIILLGPFPSGREAEHPRREAIREIHRRIAPLGRLEGVEYHDFSPAFSLPDGNLNPVLMAGDFIHLKGPGYEVWANELEPIVAGALNE